MPAVYGGEVFVVLLAKSALRKHVSLRQGARRGGGDRRRARGDGRGLRRSSLHVRSDPGPRARRGGPIYGRRLPGRR